MKMEAILKAAQIAGATVEQPSRERILVTNDLNHGWVTEFVLAPHGNGETWKLLWPDRPRNDQPGTVRPRIRRLSMQEAGFLWTALAHTHDYPCGAYGANEGENWRVTVRARWNNDGSCSLGVDLIYVKPVKNAYANKAMTVGIFTVDDAELVSAFYEALIDDGEACWNAILDHVQEHNYDGCLHLPAKAEMYP